MPSPRLVVGGVIIDRSGDQPRVLAARRTGPPALAGRWEFPGGKVEAGESPQAALVRELHEELEIDVAVSAEICPANGGTWPISEHYAMRLFVCGIESGRPQPADSHDEVRWLSAEELSDVPWLDSDTQALDGIAGALRADAQ